MVKRRFWQERIERAWKKRNVVWLSGVRRSGKTMLAQSLDPDEYLDCELPRVRRLLEDPEALFDGLKGRRVVFDEIHRAAAPSEVLKIAADHYPTIRVLATGSSRLGASARFRDTLTGRKEEVWLTPLTIAEVEDFGGGGLDHRLLHGGLPPMFQAKEFPESWFQEWMDSFWARDIQELFRVGARAPFLRFCELVLSRSGGIFSVSTFSRDCEVSRPTIGNYLAILEEAHAAHVLRPYTTHKRAEIVSAPKVFGMDTGFVCAFRGWRNLRAEDRGLLWEHLVLNELHAAFGRRGLHYWRDKAGHEVDLVFARPGRPPVAIECKWSTAGFDPAAFRAFAAMYPAARLMVVGADVIRKTESKTAGIKVTFLPLAGLPSAITHPG